MLMVLVICGIVRGEHPRKSVAMSQTPGNDIDGDIPRRSDRRPTGRRRRWLWAVPVVAVLLAAGAFLAVQQARSVTVADISPADGAQLNTRPVTVSCALAGFVPGRGTVALSIDGTPVDAGDLSVQPGLVLARVALGEGRHTAAVTYDSSNVFSRHLGRTWAFEVDTTAPEVTVAAPASFPLLRAQRSDLAFDLTEAATVSLSLDGVSVKLDGAGGPAGSSGGPAAATIVTAEGLHTLALTATDGAGNVTARQWELVVDYNAPTVSAQGLPDGDVWNEHNSATGTVTVADSFPDKLQVSATLDGVALALGESGAPAAGRRAYSFDTGTLAEGTHDLEISAGDLAGHATAFKRTFLVDTSSTFGQRTLKTGAIGGDVQQLQRILVIKGVYAGKPDGEFGEGTAAAVAAFNAQQALDGGEVVTKDTLRYLLGSIRVDLSERKLYLYRGDGNVAKTYRVAVGMPRYPTPVGDFRVIKKEVDPTWDPPNSDWAAGMGPIPPGPGNPLGTRWMGLNSPGIGIHGTYTSSSIGTAASHGCIRMRVGEAEDLFTRVFVGTPVEIVK